MDDRDWKQAADAAYYNAVSAATRAQEIAGLASARARSHEETRRAVQAQAWAALAWAAVAWAARARKEEP